MVKIDINGLVKFRRVIDGLACRFDLVVIQPGIVGENVLQDLPRVNAIVLEGGIAEVYVKFFGQSGGYEVTDVASDVVGIHDAFLGDAPLIEYCGALIRGRSSRDDWDSRLARRNLPSATGDVEVFRCWYDHSEMTMLASTEWRSDLTEVVVEAVPFFDVVLVCRIADAAGKFLAEKLLSDLVELHFRRSWELDVLGRNGRCLSGQGNGCGNVRLLACGGQGDGVVDGRLLALGGDHVFGRLVGACCIFRWVLFLCARFKDVC